MLVVDDDEEFLAETASGLHDFCQHVATASTPQLAIAALEGQPVEVVLCDLVLGDADGRHLLEEIRSRWPDTARILVTGYAHRLHLVDSSLLSSAHAVATKPCDTWTLVGLFQEQLERLRAEKKDRRSHMRREVRRRAQLTAGDTISVVALEDLSCAGARLCDAPALTIGDQVALSFAVSSNPIELAAVVQWVRDREIGVLFVGLTAGQLQLLARFLGNRG